MAKEFFEGEQSCIDVKVKMIYDGEDGDIINQYVIFTKVCNEQIAIHGRSQNAVLEAISICRDRNVAEYLSSKEKEVVDIMMVLYDEQEIMKSYVESEVYESKIETAKRFLRMNKLSYEEIAVGSELTIEEVKKLAGLESD